MVPVAAWQTKADRDPAHDLDFWVGKWSCEGELYDAAGKVTKTAGRNEITKILGDKVVRESFSMEGFNGLSVSAYDPAKKVWRQTWVDDSGSYLSFAGGYDNGLVILSMEPTKDGKVKRMVFHNIKETSFDWKWESSTDSGKTWRLLWLLHYKRDNG